MAKVIAVTDEAGVLAGVLRADPFDSGNGRMIQAVPVPRQGYRHHILDLPEDLLGKPAHEVHREVRQRLAGAGAKHKP